MASRSCPVHVHPHQWNVYHVNIIWAEWSETLGEQSVSELSTTSYNREHRKIIYLFFNEWSVHCWLALRGMLLGLQITWRSWQGSVLVLDHIAHNIWAQLNVIRASLQKFLHNSKSERKPLRHAKKKGAYTLSIKKAGINNFCSLSLFCPPYIYVHQ